MPKERSTYAVNVELPKDWHAAIHSYAKSRDLSVAQVIRGLIRQLLEKNDDLPR